VAHFGDDFEQVLLNDGAGYFLPGDKIPEAGAGLVFADLDADGDLDIAGFLANSDGVEEPLIGLRVLRNDGAGIFGAPEDLLTEGTPEALAAGDFDGDGDTDIVLAERGSTFEEPSGLQLFRNDGAGRFTPDALAENESVFFSELAAGDFNGDGVTDVALSDFDSIDILLNDGAGGFTSAGIFLGVEDHVEAPIAQDLNGDGRLDLAFLSGKSNTVVSLLIGAGDGTFSQQDLRVGPTKTFSLLDLDGDGLVELLRVPRRRDVVEASPLGL
jgi:hypothetical protein